MRALPSLLVAGAVGLGGLFMASAPAEAHGGWRGRHYYDGYYAPRFYGGYGGYYAPPPVYYRPPPPVYYRPPPVYYAPPRAYYAPPPAYYAPRTYGFAPRPGVGVFVR